MPSRAGRGASLPLCRIPGGRHCQRSGGSPNVAAAAGRSRLVMPRPSDRRRPSKMGRRPRAVGPPFVPHGMPAAGGRCGAHGPSGPRWVGRRALRAAASAPMSSWGARPPRNISLWGRKGERRVSPAGGGPRHARRSPVPRHASRRVRKARRRPRGVPGRSSAGPPPASPPGPGGRPALRGRSGRGLPRAASMRPDCLIIHVFTMPEIPYFTGFSAGQAR